MPISNILITTVDFVLSPHYNQYKYNISEVDEMKNDLRKNKERKLTEKDYSLKNGKFLDEATIHGKGTNFLGNIFKS